MKHCCYILNLRCSYVTWHRFRVDGMRHWYTYVTYLGWPFQSARTLCATHFSNATPVATMLWPRISGTCVTSVAEILNHAQFCHRRLRHQLMSSRHISQIVQSLCCKIIRCEVLLSAPNSYPWIKSTYHDALQYARAVHRAHTGAHTAHTPCESSS